MFHEQPIRVRGVRYEQRVGKRIERAPDGVKNAALPRPSSGTVINLTFASWPEYFQWLDEYGRAGGQLRPGFAGGPEGAPGGGGMKRSAATIPNENALAAANSQGARATYRTLPFDYNLLAQEIEWRHQLLAAEQARAGRPQIVMSVTAQPEGLELYWQCISLEGTQSSSGTDLRPWEIATEWLRHGVSKYDRMALNQGRASRFLRKPTYLERQQGAVPADAVILVSGNCRTIIHDRPNAEVFTEVVDGVANPAFASFDESLISRLAAHAGTDHGGGRFGASAQRADRHIVRLPPSYRSAMLGVAP